MTEEIPVKLFIYSAACQQLNKLSEQIKQLEQELAQTKQAYYSTMKHCDQLVGWFASRNLDPEELLERLGND